MTIGNRIGISAIMVLMAIAHSVYAQQWPQRPIRWISPFAPGGGADMTSRAIAAKLSTSLGHQVLVDNRGGAGGMIGLTSSGRPCSIFFKISTRSSGSGFKSCAWFH